MGFLRKAVKAVGKEAKKAIGGSPVPSVRQVVRAVKRANPVAGVLKTTKALNKASKARPRRR